MRPTASSTPIPPLLAVEDLVFADLARRGFVLDDRRVVVDMDVGEGVCTAAVGEQEAIALRVVAGILCIGTDIDEPAVAILALTSADTLRDDAATSVLPEVDHLRTGVGLLEVIRDSDGVEFGYGVIPFEHTAGVLPRDRRAVST